VVQTRLAREFRDGCREAAEETFSLESGTEFNSGLYEDILGWKADGRSELVEAQDANAR
jgi:hypothetical protein